MKKTLLIVLVMILSMGASTSWAMKSDSKLKSDKPAVTVTNDNKLTVEQKSILTKRVQEIRQMDKSKMTITEKRELKNELKAIKETVKKDGGYIYIGGGTLLLIIILLILFL